MELIPCLILNTLDLDKDCLIGFVVCGTLDWQSLPDGESSHNLNECENIVGIVTHMSN